MDIRRIKLNALKQKLSFPLEKKYQAFVEHDLAQTMKKANRIVCSIILLTQIIMIFSISLRPGGPWKTERRTGYFFLYLLLIAATLSFQFLTVLLQKRNQLSDTLYLSMGNYYMCFLCIWGCAITLLDQLGGNGLSVYSYMIVTVAAFSCFKPWQAIVVFSGCFMGLNFFLPMFQAGIHNYFSNLMNSLFITTLSILISCLLYHSRVFSSYNQLIIKNQYEEIYKINKELQKQVLTDQLTGLYNRRYFEEVLGKHLEQCRQKQIPIAAMMIDIDFFKQYNDYYGHLAGDQCLQQVGSIILDFASAHNISAVRYGGEEFFLCLFGYNKCHAKQMAEKLRCSLENSNLLREDTAIGHITVSIGVCTLATEQKQTLQELVHCCDKALYEAKSNGRNQVSFYEKEKFPVLEHNGGDLA